MNIEHRTLLRLVFDTAAVLCSKRKAVFWDEIAMGDFGVNGSIFWYEGAIGIASAFEDFLRFTFDAFGIVLGTEFFGRVVAVSLEGVDLASEAAEDADGASVFIGI